jgi:uncharacterized phiE125 gp8 family phage protein
MVTPPRPQPLPPVTSADEAIRGVHVACCWTDTYLLDGAGSPPRLVRRASLAWPSPGKVANGIEIAFIAGYGDAAANVPAPIRQSILLLVAHWHEHREPIAISAPGAPVPPTVSDLLQPYRQVRL